MNMNLTNNQISKREGETVQLPRALHALHRPMFFLISSVCSKMSAHQFRDISHINLVGTELNQNLYFSSSSKVISHKQQLRDIISKDKILKKKCII